MFTEVAAWTAKKAAETSIEEALKDKKEIKKLFKSAWKRIFKGKTVVVITGLGGSGKSKLQQILSGEVEIQNIDAKYALSMDNEKTSAKDDYFCKIYTRPGQVEKLSIHDDEIKSAWTGARRIIVINVVTYGYNALHQVPLAGISSKLSNKNQDKTAINYIENQRLAEISNLSEFLVNLGGLKGTQQVDVMTVLNKMDLWWSEREAVKNHYEQSEYNTIIQKFKESRNGNLRDTMSAVSLIMLNLRTLDGVDLATLSPGFDALLKQINFEQFQADMVKFIG